MIAFSIDERIWQPGRNQPSLHRSPSPSWKEDHGILTWPLQGTCATGENIFGLRSSCRREEGEDDDRRMLTSKLSFGLY